MLPRRETRQFFVCALPYRAPMKQVTLGRTNLTVGIAGLGCGGPSRLGTARGATTDEAAALVRLAFDHGVTFIDTAESYGTEPAVGQAIAEIGRDRVVLSSKQSVTADWKSDQFKSAEQFLENLDASLKRLGTDYLDLYHAHGVMTHELDHTLDVIVPAMQQAKAAGKIRHLALSEAFAHDTDHQALQQLLDRSDDFDVLMVGFTLLNPSARLTVFPTTQERGVGTLSMFTVRRALSNEQKRAETLAAMNLPGDCLDFLLDEAGSLPEAAYRFAAHEPGMDVILFGTGNADHLKENIESCNKPPLSETAQSRLRELFGHRSDASGN